VGSVPNQEFIQDLQQVKKCKQLKDRFMKTIASVEVDEKGRHKLNSLISLYEQMSNVFEHNRPIQQQNTQNQQNQHTPTTK